MDAPVPQLDVALVEANSCPLGVQLVNSRKTNKISEATDLVELAQAIQKADEFTKANVSNKLVVIAEQMRFLQNQARRILMTAQRDATLHHTACNLVKKAGTIYYLYQRESGQNYLSILSPQEWGSSCPHEFLGGYRLEPDHSWTSVQDLAKKDQEKSLIGRILRPLEAIKAPHTTDDHGWVNATQFMDEAEEYDLFQGSL